MMPSGEHLVPERGTPQGGVISPLLANLFLHYVFDVWMKREYPNAPFERYADDAVVHCCSVNEANNILEALRERFRACGLELNDSKTKRGYCKDSRRGEEYPHKQFRFLGFDFKPRTARARDGRMYSVFTPGVSRENQKQLVRRMRSWQIQRHTARSLAEINELCAPTLRGWIRYFQAFRRSAMYRTLHLFNVQLTDWSRSKYRVGRRRAVRSIQRICRNHPTLFPHWVLGCRP